MKIIPIILSIIYTNTTRIKPSMKQRKNTRNDQIITRNDIEKNASASAKKLYNIFE